MANEQNLRPCEYKFTEEDHKKAVIKSAEARRLKKTMRENAELLLSLPLKNSKLKDQIKELGIEDNEVTNQMALIVSLYQKALKGDVQAFNSLQATKGEKPVERVETTNIPVVISGADEIEE